MNYQLQTELQKRKEYLEKIISEKEKALQNSPSGKLRYNRIGKHISYYCRTDPKDTQGKYIKAEDRAFAAALAQKDYDERVLKEAAEELQDVGKYLSKHEEGYIEEIWEKLREPRRRLIRPVMMPDEEFVKNWLSVDYEKKGFPDEAAEYYTAKGERVRSKSEIIIADTLGRMNVPYRYEYPFKLKGTGIIHPDFTVLNIRLRKSYLWEHLGMMDDPDYAENALSRINAYEKQGYYPGDRLIITHETKQYPLRTKLIEELISCYLI